MTGAGTVCIANKKLVEEVRASSIPCYCPLINALMWLQYTKNLQREGLTVSMAPDDEFEAGDEDEDGDAE